MTCGKMIHLIGDDSITGTVVRGAIVDFDAMSDSAFRVVIFVGQDQWLSVRDAMNEADIEVIAYGDLSTYRVAYPHSRI